MKTANTIENKVKFFGHHIGQEMEYNFNAKTKKQIMLGVYENSALYKVGESGFSGVPLSKVWLNLRSASSITDEEYTELITMQLNYREGLSVVSFDKKYKDIPTVLFQWLQTNGKYVKCEVAFLDGSKDFSKVSVKQYQYLESKGVALDYLDLSIDDLISYGWIKLKA
jgi:hypothetical protein